MIESIKLKTDIIKFINELITYGHDKGTIIDTVARKYDVSDLIMVTSMVDDEIKDHGSYGLIQKIMRSKVVVNAETDDIRIVDIKSRNCETISNRVLHSVFNRKVDVNSFKYYCKFDYDPFSTNILDSDGNGTWTYNIYQPPSWYKNTYYSAGKKEVKFDEMPEIYTKFFKHLTDDDEKSTTYIVDWLANGIQSRNFCILSTIGKPGIGKGVLGNIMRGLFGKSNYYAGSDRMFKTKFNSQIMNKRLVYCDEISIKSKEDEDRIKLVVNDFIEVEKKGIDAQEIPNYANFYISSNNLDSIKISGDDRRFSIVNLTDKLLIETMDDKDIREVLDPKNIDMLGGFLYYRKIDKEHMKRVFVSKRTQEVRESALKEWQDWFLSEYCFENKGKTLKQTVVSDDVEDKYGSKFRPSRTSLQRLRDQLPKDQRIFDIRKKSMEGRQVWCVDF